MKKYLTFSKLIKISLIILLVFQLTGCGVNSFDDVKQNGVKVTEYNKTIELYNKAATSFTNLAKFVDKQLKEEKDGYIDEISTRYDEKGEEIVKNIKKLETKEFKRSEVEVCMDDIRPMLSHMYDYLDMVKIIKQIDPKEIPSFHEDLTALYDKILKQSFVATETFEDIYQEHIINSED